MTSGVYRIRHKRSGAAYVGGSIDIEHRWSWHLSMLKHGKHTSPKLQSLWTKYGRNAFVLEILKKTRSKKLRVIEDEFARKEKKLLNEHTNFGFKHSEEVKIKMCAGRAEYLKDPLARKSLSDRAKKQHAAGKLGHQTWKEGTIRKYNPINGIRGGERLRAHIAAQSSEEMSRRAKLRRRFYNRWTGEYVLIR